MRILHLFEVHQLVVPSSAWIIIFQHSAGFSKKVRINYKLIDSQALLLQHTSNYQQVGHLPADVGEPIPIAGLPLPMPLVIAEVSVDDLLLTPNTWRTCQLQADYWPKSWAMYRRSAEVHQTFDGMPSVHETSAAPICTEGHQLSPAKFFAIHCEVGIYWQTNIQMFEATAHSMS